MLAAAIAKPPPPPVPPQRKTPYAAKCLRLKGFTRADKERVNDGEGTEVFKLPNITFSPYGWIGWSPNSNFAEMFVDSVGQMEDDNRSLLEMFNFPLRDIINQKRTNNLILNELINRFRAKQKKHGVLELLSFNEKAEYFSLYQDGYIEYDIGNPKFSDALDKYCGDCHLELCALGEGDAFVLGFYKFDVRLGKNKKKSKIEIVVHDGCTQEVQKLLQNSKSRLTAISLGCETNYYLKFADGTEHFKGIVEGTESGILHSEASELASGMQKIFTELQPEVVFSNIDKNVYYVKYNDQSFDVSGGSRSVDFDHDPVGRGSLTKEWINDSITNLWKFLTWYSSGGPNEVKRKLELERRRIEEAARIQSALLQRKAEEKRQVDEDQRRIEEEGERKRPTADRGREQQQRLQKEAVVEASEKEQRKFQFEQNKTMRDEEEYQRKFQLEEKKAMRYEEEYQRKFKFEEKKSMRDEERRTLEEEHQRKFQDDEDQRQAFEEERRRTEEERNQAAEEMRKAKEERRKNREAAKEERRPAREAAEEERRKNEEERRRINKSDRQKIWDSEEANWQKQSKLDAANQKSIENEIRKKIEDEGRKKLDKDSSGERRTTSSTQKKSASEEPLKLAQNWVNDQKSIVPAKGFSLSLLTPFASVLPNASAALLEGSTETQTQMSAASGFGAENESRTHDPNATVIPTTDQTVRNGVRDSEETRISPM